MNDSAKLECWNFQVLMLGQALLGGITPNFRMVVLSRESGVWLIKFYLEKHVADDISEIEDLMCQYTAYQGVSLKCRSEIFVGSESLPNMSGVDRAVYRRKE